MLHRSRAFRAKRAFVRAAEGFVFVPERSGATFATLLAHGGPSVRYQACAPCRASDALSLLRGGVKLWHFGLIGLLSLFVVGHLGMVAGTGLVKNMRKIV